MLDDQTFAKIVTRIGKLLNAAERGSSEARRRGEPIDALAYRIRAEAIRAVAKIIEEETNK